MAACKNHGSLYQDAAGKKSAGGQWEIDANQAIFPPLTQGYSRGFGFIRGYRDFAFRFGDSLRRAFP
jgi:hypothetical protein